MREVPESEATNEPDGGWVEGSQLWSTPLISTVLCRYTGIGMPRDQVCLERVAGQHPDEPCWEQFHSATAILADVIIPTPATNVRHGADGPTEHS